jgi:hypothetical protein
MYMYMKSLIVFSFKKSDYEMLDSLSVSTAIIYLLPVISQSAPKS